MIYTLFFQQLLFGFLGLLITYFAGKLITSFFSVNGGFFFRLFVSYIIGITAIVLFYSIIKTQGQTINILLLPIIGFLLYYFRDSFVMPSIPLKLIIKELSWSAFPFMLIFLYQSWWIFDFSNGWIRQTTFDLYAYASYSDSLRISGIENRDLGMTYFYPELCGTVPYHYAELWFTAFFSELFTNAAVNNYYFVMYPVLVTIFTIGLSSLFQNRIKKKILALTISFLLLFITGFKINNSVISIVCAHYNIAGGFGLKLAWIYIFLLLGFITWNTNRTAAYCVLISIPVFSFIFLPGIWGGFIIYFAGSIIFHLPKINRNSLWDEVSIRLGWLCVKVNVGARCGMVFLGRPAMLI